MIGFPQLQQWCRRLANVAFAEALRTAARRCAPAPGAGSAHIHAGQPSRTAIGNRVRGSLPAYST